MNASDRRTLNQLMTKGRGDIRASLQSLLDRSVPHRLVKPMQRKREAVERQKRLSKREETARIRAAVEARAEGCCEYCSSTFSFPDPAEMDHWLGGSGRRRQEQSVETCWLLHRNCHRLRQEALPSAAHWNENFKRHCKKYGYRFTPHIEHQPLRRRAINRF